MRDWLAYVPRRGAEAFAYASALGGYFGLTLFVVGSALFGSDVVAPSPFEVPGLVFAFLAYGLIVIPFCCLGLMLFGVPMALLLRQWWHAPWVAVLALAWSMVAGGVFLTLLDWILWNHPLAFVWGAMMAGAGFGLPTGFWAWLLYRRVLRHRAATE